MRLKEIIRENNPFTEPLMTDEEEVAYFEHRATAIFATNQKILLRWKVDTFPSSPYFSQWHRGIDIDPNYVIIEFGKINKEFATAKENIIELARYVDKRKLSSLSLTQMTKQAKLTKLQAREYPPLVSKIKRLRQKLESKVTFDPSNLPTKIPIPGSATKISTTRTFNNPAIIYPEEQYAGPPSTFSWPGISRAFYYAVRKFLKTYLNINDFDIVYSGKGTKFNGKIRSSIIAIAADGNIIWSCDSQWEGRLYFPGGNWYSVDEVIRPFVEGKLTHYQISSLKQSIKDFKK